MKKLRQQIEKEYRREVEKAAHLLLNNADSSEVKPSLERVENYNKLLTVLQSAPLIQRAWFLGITLVCLIIAGLVWSVRISHTHVLLNIQSGNVGFRLAAPLVYQANLHQKADQNKEVQIYGVTELKIDGAQFSNSLVARGDQIEITGLNLDANSEIEVTSDQDFLIIYARGGLHGEVAYLGTTSFSDGDNQLRQTKNVEVPGTIKFASDGKGASPAVIKIRPSNSLLLQNLEVSKISFSQLNSTGPGSERFETTIRKGSITLYDASSTETLQEGDRLSLAGVDGKCSRVWLENGVNSICEATVQKVLFGPTGAERNLAPSYVEYLHKNKTLGYVWSAVGLVWGILWALQKNVLRG